MLQLTDWGELVSEECRKVIQSKGINNISYESLLNEVFESTKDQVDPEIKQQAIYQINQILIKEKDPS